MEAKKAWTADLERILWNQAAHSRGWTEARTRFDVPEGTGGVTGVQLHSFRAALAGEGVHGNGPQAVHGHPAQRGCHL